MILAGFSKKDTANETVHRMIRCCLKAHKAKQMIPCRDAPNPNAKEVRIVTNNDADPSPLTGRDNDPMASATTTTMTTGPTHPKRKIFPTVSTIQQRRANNLAVKRHKSNAHKAAVRLFKAEKQKHDGMSLRLVYDAITAKHETCPNIMIISHYAKKQQRGGMSRHVNVAKMKKDKKLAVWVVVIVSSGRAPPLYERWTGVDIAKLLEAQSDIVEMAHTALGHLEKSKKKELVLAAMCVCVLSSGYRG